jgi:hypothetical protein
VKCLTPKNRSVEYKFEVPKRLNKKKLDASAIRGGYCQSPKVIYVYGFGCEAQDGDPLLYEHILEHEHLHALLRKFKIPLQFHHLLLQEIARAKYSN